ncbi:MAG: polyprenyl synthetase family protein [Bacillota bacterium]
MSTTQTSSDQLGQGIPYLHEVEKRLEEVAGSSGTAMQQLASHLLLAGGKRLRPALVILTSTFGSADPRELVEVAVASELIHVASLIHDDIIDESNERRGRPSVNARWGNHAAVLTGDYLFATAFNILSNCRQTRIIELATEAIRLMCEGEIEQAAQAHNCDLTEEDYLGRVSKKTGSLISACCRAGAVLCGLSDAEVQKAGEFGLHLGCSFQIVDDVMDLASSPAVLGKPAGADLAKGILTLPVLYLLQDATHGPTVRQMISRRDYTPDTFAYIREGLHQAGALTYAFGRAQALSDQAKASLDTLPQAPVKEILNSFTDMMLKRVH